MPHRREWALPASDSRAAGFEPGGLYRLRADVFLADRREVPVEPGWSRLRARSDDRYLLRQPAEAPGGEAHAWWMNKRWPKTVAEYTAAPGKWPEIDAVVPAGTFIRFHKLKLFHLVTWERVGAYGVMAEGPHVGTIVGLTPISEPPGVKFGHVAFDERFLEPVPAADVPR